MKKLISVILCLVLLLAFAIPAQADSRVLSNVNDMARLQQGEDVHIYKARLYQDGVNPTEVYVVVCDGMDFSDYDVRNARSVTSGMRIALSDEYNVFVRTVISAIQKEVPKGSKLVCTGISLGGMVVQQVIAQKVVKDNYQVLHTLSIASPYILTKGTKEGTLRRMVDLGDIVPYLSIAGLANPLIGNVSIECSFYGKTVHMDGYYYGKCWQKYDALGVKNGKAYIVLE